MANNASLFTCLKSNSKSSKTYKIVEWTHYPIDVEMNNVECTNQIWRYHIQMDTSSIRRFFCHSEDFPIVVLRFQLIVVSMHSYRGVECSLWKTFEALRWLYFSGLYPLACSSCHFLEICVFCMSASRTIFPFVWLDRTRIPVKWNSRVIYPLRTSFKLQNTRAAHISTDIAWDGF